MLFTQLNTLLPNCSSLTMTVVPGQDGQITITVIPKPKLTQNAESLSTPLRLTGTPDELDEQFVELFGKYSSSHISLAEQIETTTSILEAAKAESVKKASKALASPKEKSESKSTHASPSNVEDESDPDDDFSDGGSSSTPETQPGEDSKPSTSASESTGEPVNQSDSLWS